MVTKSTTVNNPTGMHARPASDFVALAKSFESSITISAGEEKVNAKSIIRLLAAGIGPGVTVTLEAEGPDEQQAVDQLIALIDSGFGER